MRDKRIKLIFFSLKGSEVKDYAIGWKKLFLLSTMVIVFLIILIGAGFKFFTNIYHNSQLMSLQKVNTNLRLQLQEMRKNIDQVKQQLKRLEGEDDELRMIAGLDTIDQDMRMVGVGGPENIYADDFNIFPDEIRNEVFETRDLIDELKREIQLLSESRQEIDLALKNKADKIKHLPTIKPVRIGRITAYFGMRIDPFTEKRAMHYGIDIGAPEGTPIFSPADGVVVRVLRSYKSNKGYGKLVVIDHGNGIQTLYGHLSKISVKLGQKVKRWDVIGEVGETGRATGPHLHYEVISFGKKENPIKYIFE